MTVTPNPAHQKILILDFGSQVTKLIARRVREGRVYCEIHPHTMDIQAIRAFQPCGIILSGGPRSVTEQNAARVDDAVFTLGIPILGICYGQQTMCQQLGGLVEGGHHREFGKAMLDIRQDSPLYRDFWQTGNAYPVWMSHGDRVTRLPEGFHVIGTSENASCAMIADEQRRFYGVQFHPEVVHTPQGAALLQSFVRTICGASGDWTMASYRQESIQRLREQVGDGIVICGLSGGVDSAVTAVLLHEAIGEQLVCVFVDNGLLRKDEATQVLKTFRDQYHINLIHHDASALFLERLAGVDDPERKRKIIGAAFVEVFEAEARKITGARFLAQGTLYPDVIESAALASGVTTVIKSHHNVGGLPEKMGLALVEPLRELFKDEVRALGRELGMPDAMVGRHPFPGPGLAVRIPGVITPEKLAILREADAVYIDEIRKAGLYDHIWQAFAVLLPVRTVGVMGDARSYDYACALRAVTSDDGMTAEAFPFPPDFLFRTATRMINEVRGINRIVYDVTSKPPGTIEWE